MKALILAVILGATAGKGPYIKHQVSTMVMHEYASPTWQREIRLKNPLDRAVWLWIECESHLTTSAIGVPGRLTSTIVLPDIPPGEACMIHHWSIQRPGVHPPEWRP